MTQPAAGIAPVTSSERIGELDVLRGFALLGVLVANLFWFSATYFSASLEQMGAFFADPANAPAIFAVDWLVSDKANTTFATLFGMGFWVQMQRIEQRGGAFAAVYLRRLFILMALGLINILLIWPWDILFIYSIAGLLLFLLRKLPARTMLAIGIVLIFARPVLELLAAAGGFEAIGEQAFSEAAAAQRNAVFVSGTYPQWVGEAWQLFWTAGMRSLEIPIWVVYALGRFMIGASIVRSGWLERIPEVLPQLRRVFWACLLLGLAGEAVFSVGLIADDFLSEMLHAASSYALAFGYGTGLVLFFNSARLRGMVECLAPVGRMALTNYMTQGVFIGFVLYGFHGGMALAGTIGGTTTLMAALLFFIAQVAFSHLWLARYRFGPLEWLWRGLTYGKFAPIRRETEAP
ncbi:DUF418 domain-containing protein [Aurantiacibacter sp. MUD11]|uniref:DUF418 domain-containing protein n=1 Tax=Aurantiacibacter sp. MUD11 TaxID=3003265 RepID=UPI0022AA2483|nr:DUF418 domain-containing protein [Aurantiacibacter sp. MUD11]WAT18021.1 DUF418 domain-containing protein [Aurantiacibacter sp. MUD11]